MVEGKGLGAGVLRAAILGILAAGSAIAPTRSVAQTGESAQEAKLRFDIPSGPLADALQRYAEIAAVQLVYSSELVADLRTAGLSDTLTLHEALTRLLDGSNLVAKYSGRTVTLVRAVDAQGRRVLSPVRVEGATPGDNQRERRGEGVSSLIGVRGGQDQETRGFRPVVTTAGAGVPTPIEDLPRSVSVITQEQIDLQDIDDIGEALRRMPGVTVTEQTTLGARGAGLEIYSRGQRIESFQIDGGAARPMYADSDAGSEDLVGSGGLLDLAAYERLEVVRGASGTQVGGATSIAGSTGSPGGALNLVRKRPSAYARDTLNLSAGSFDQYRMMYDVSRPTLFDTPIAARAVVSLSEQGFHYDNVKNEGKTFYGIVDIPMSEQSRVELGVQHSLNKQNGNYYGFYRYADGPLYDRPRSFNPIPEWSYFDGRSTELFGRLSIDLPGEWSFRVQGFQSSSNTESLMFFYEPNLLSTTGTPPDGVYNYGGSTISEAHSRNFGLDAYLAGQFRLWGLKHTLSLGGDFSERSSYGGGLWASSFDIHDIADFDPSLYERPTQLPDLSSAFPRGQGGTSRRAGLLLTDVISWRDLVDLTLSLRRSFSNSASAGLTTLDSYTSASAATAREAPAWIPSYWLTIKPIEPLSVGFSYAEGSLDQSRVFTKSGRPLAPVTYENLELQVKYATPNWLASVSYYELNTTGAGTQVEPADYTCLPTGTAACYREMDTSEESRGIDFELTGRIAPGLDLIASYNRNENKSTVSGKALSTQTPAAMAKLFASWRPARLGALTIYGGASYKDAVYVSGVQNFYEPAPPYELITSVPYDFNVDSYVTIDVGARYRISNRLELSLFVENVTDEVYLSTIGIANSYYGRPRSFTLELKATDLAAGRWNSTPPEDTTFLGQGWYSTLEFGVPTSPSIEARSTGPASTGERVEWQWDLDGKYALFGRFGRMFGTHWQAELEAGARSMDFTSIGEAGGGGTGLCAGGYGAAEYPACDEPGGALTIASVLTNVVYRFGDDHWRVRPFVGVGLGGARVSLGIGGRARESSEVAIGGASEDYVLAGQLFAGIDVNFTQRLSAEISYRHFETQRAEWDTLGGASSFGGPAPLSTLGAFRAPIEIGAATVGLRYSFGN